LANKAAIKAMLVNRIADVFFTLSIVLIFLTFGTTDFMIVFTLIPLIKVETYVFLGLNLHLISVIAFFLFIGAIGKSAQFGLHT